MRSKLHKGINIWSFDQSRSIEQCMRLAKDAGFEGIELAMAKDGPLGLTSSDQEILAVKALAQEIGIQICSLATGLYWQYSLTATRLKSGRRQNRWCAAKSTWPPCWAWTAFWSAPVRWA